MAYIQRNADWVITKAYLTFKGKAVPPASSTNKYAAMLSLVDSEQKEWAAEEGIEWSSLYSLVPIGTVSATDSFYLDDSIDYVSQREGDYIRLVSPDGTTTRQVFLVDPDQLYQYRNNLAATVAGRVLLFSKPFASTDSVIGYTIKVPSILSLDDVTTGSSLIQCDDPLYLAYKVAAELARNDTVKMGQYQNILDKANVMMEKMKSTNGGQEPSVTNSQFAQGMTWV